MNRHARRSELARYRQETGGALDTYLVDPDQPLDVPILRNAARSWLDSLPRQMRSCIVCSGLIWERQRVGWLLLSVPAVTEAASGIRVRYLHASAPTFRLRRWNVRRRSRCRRRCRVAFRPSTGARHEAAPTSAGDWSRSPHAADAVAAGRARQVLGREARESVLQCRGSTTNAVRDHLQRQAHPDTPRLLGNVIAPRTCARPRLVGRIEALLWCALKILHAHAAVPRA